MMMASDKKNRGCMRAGFVRVHCIAAHNLLSNINSVFIRVLVRMCGSWGTAGAYTENNRAPLPRVCAALRCQYMHFLYLLNKTDKAHIHTFVSYIRIRSMQLIKHVFFLVSCL